MDLCKLKDKILVENTHTFLMPCDNHSKNSKKKSGIFSLHFCDFFDMLLLLLVLFLMLPQVVRKLLALKEYILSYPCKVLSKLCWQPLRIGMALNMGSQKLTLFSISVLQKVGKLEFFCSNPCRHSPDTCSKHCCHYRGCP